MKKLFLGLTAVAALSSSAALADTPAVRELNDFGHIQTVASKSHDTNRPSEFVIYHQDSHRPCPPQHPHMHEKGKMMHHHHTDKHEHKSEHRHEHKHDDKHHVHHHHHHDDMKKDKDADVAKPAKKPAVSEQNQNGDSNQ